LVYYLNRIAMKIINYLTVLLLVFSLISCFEDINPVDATLVIKNDSAGDIAYYLQTKKSNDTSLYTNSFALTTDNFATRIIPAQGALEIPGSYKKVFRISQRGEVMMVFLFSRDTIEQVPWERIADEYMVLKRFDLTLDSLERRNWVLEYP